MIKAIETTYKGYRFRSRLEARWAVFFDTLDLRWEYEPEGFVLPSGAHYLPDFRVEYPGRNATERHYCWFEVKGDLGSVGHDEFARMIEFEKEAGLVVLDGPPALRMYCCPTELVRHSGSFVRKVDSWGFAYDGPIVAVPYKVNIEQLGDDRTGWALWCPKGRLWWDDPKTFFDGGSYFGCGDDLLENAVAAARAARFEHHEREHMAKV